MYKVQFSKSFSRSLNKLVKQNKLSIELIDSTLQKLAKDPFDRALKTHKVSSKLAGRRYSSRLTGDLRLIWDFSNGNLEILMIDIGGHSGSNKVYK